jgi:hypothetical protein
VFLPRSKQRPVSGIDAVGRARIAFNHSGIGDLS